LGGEAVSRLNLLKAPDEAAVARAKELFGTAIGACYGDRLKGLYVFGSRARGDFRPFSDLDVAVILAGEDVVSFEERKALADIAYDLLLDTGVEIQPWPIAEQDWIEPPPDEGGALVRAAKRDARAIPVSP
jgi:antitoxin ChpS